ncbi:MAG TPA: hypothetical protein DCM71_05190, partial [Runella sp.]|nr:hypothetical protein [Runella sp.]
MVEAQQGVSTFLSFGTKSVKPGILEELLIGRREDVNLLTKFVNEIAQDGLNHQVIVVGQRGMGKTHILRVLYQRSQVFLKDKKLKIAYFSEEEYGIAGYLDFLIRVLNAFIRWNEEDRETLNLQMDGLRETHPNRQIEAAEKAILDYIGDRPLLILAENFDDILEALGKEGQSKLRSFLYRHSRTSIIATAQALSPDLGREDRPFYGFFTTIYLKKLNYEDSLELIRHLAEIEKQTNVLEHLKRKGKAQVRAIHELVKGNHRLLVTFYEFLKADTLAALSTIFIKTLNDLKPYYETFIRYLPPQQQKILHYLALEKMAQNGTEIGKHCFIDSKTLSKQLSELQRRKLIDAIPDPYDKRNKLYDISEPLLRISIEIGEHKEGISALFIDFLALYYSFDELQTQKARFLYLYKCETDPQRKQELYYDLEARGKAISLKAHLEANKKESRALREMRENHKQGDYRAVLILAEEMPDSERNGEFYYYLGYSQNKFKEFKKSIEAFQKSIEFEPDYYGTWYSLGVVFNNKEETEKAIEAFQKVIELKPNQHPAWNNLGAIFEKKGEIQKAIEAYRRSIDTGVNFIKNEKWLPREDVLEMVSETILFILQNSKILTIKEIQDLEKIIEQGYEMPKELQTLYRYLQIFRRFVLQKEEKAIYELPKEQREFFI